MGVSLRPYQEQAAEAFERFVAAGKQRGAIVLPTGAGKTICALEVARRFGKRTLWLAHRQELIDQPYEALRDVWPEADVGIVKADRNECGAKDVVIASIQTVSRNQAARLQECGKFDLVVVDECFPPGTLVGGVPIESIRVGDLVPSFDEETMEFVDRRVTRLFTSVPTSLVSVSHQNGRLVSTWNHPVFTTRGWVSAGLLTCDDMVLGFTNDASSMLGMRRANGTTTARTVRGVQEVALRRQKHVEGLGRTLLRVRQTAGVDQEACDASPTSRTSGVLGRVSKYGTEPSFVGDCFQDEPEARSGAYEDQEPDAPTRDQGEGLDQAQGDGMETASERRERSSFACSSTPHRLRSWMADGSGCSDQATQEIRLPHLLQARRGERDVEDRRRGGRPIAPIPNAPRTGSEEGSGPSWSRVDGVEVLEPGSDGTFGGMCPDGLVFNLEVAGTHTYVAEGVVVHNCHHSVASSYVETVTSAGCMAAGGPVMLGLTATPDRAGLKDLFDGVIFDYPLRKAIEEGYLCPIGPTRQIRVPGLVLDDIRTSRGDFVQGQLGEAMLAAHVAEFTAKGIRQLAAKRRTIVFTVLVEQAELTAKCLNDLGIKAAVVCGETPDAERRSILSKFYDGEIDVVANASVLTEGYDNPRVDCIVVARPTKSSILYRQMIGRGLRPHPDKQNLMIVDLVDASNRFDIMSAAKFGREIANQGKQSPKPKAIVPNPETRISVLHGLTKIEDTVPVPEESEKEEQAEPIVPLNAPIAINWLSSQATHKKDGWFASTGEGVVCVFRATIANKVEWVVAITGDRGKRQFHRLVGRYTSDKIAFGIGADCVRNLDGGRVFATNAYPGWRDGNPTSGQIGLLKVLGVSIPKTKGEAADAITIGLGVKYGREIANMIRDKVAGRPAMWLQDYKPRAARARV